MAGVSARRYAQALFELAGENNKQESWLEDLRKIEETFSDVLVLQYLNIPQVPMDNKLSVTADLLIKFDDLLKNAISLLVYRGSINSLGNMVKEYSNLVDAWLGRTQAQVTSAVALSTGQEKKLLGFLKSMLGNEVVLTIKIKSEILGGMLIQIGDQIIDGSVKTLKTKRANSLGLNVSKVEKVLKYKMPSMNQVCKNLIRNLKK